MVTTFVRTMFAQSDAVQVRAQFARVVDQLEGQFPAAAELLTDAEADLLAFSTFPVEHWRKIWSHDGQERLIKELRRRTDVVGISPSAPRSSGSAAPCSPSSTTSGPWRGAT